MTVVALCISLPELVTAIIALAKGLGALSLGNIIGANIFNLVLVSGTAVTISPFVIPERSKLFGYNTSQIIEIPIMVGEFFCITFYSHPHSGWLFGLLFEQTSLKALKRPGNPFFGLPGCFCCLNSTAPLLFLPFSFFQYSIHSDALPSLNTISDISSSGIKAPLVSVRVLP